jgi:chromosome segregation ATPase
MMIRFTTLSTCIALSLVSAVGCDKAVDEQKKADEARTDADKKVTDANRDATDKINAARAEADKKVADAQAGFLKLREDFRHQVTGDLVAVDKSIADLDAKEKTAKGKTKTQIDAAMPNIHTLRDSVMTEYRSLELSSALTWDASKARVDKAVDDLKKAIDKAD